MLLEERVIDLALGPQVMEQHRESAGCRDDGSLASPGSTSCFETLTDSPFGTDLAFYNLVNKKYTAAAVPTPKRSARAKIMGTRERLGVGTVYESLGGSCIERTAPVSPRP